MKVFLFPDGDIVEIAAKSRGTVESGGGGLDRTGYCLDGERTNIFFLCVFQSSLYL